jgi:hypothetical protein
VNSIEIYEVNVNGVDSVKLKIYDSSGSQICTETIPGNILPETCGKCCTAIIYSSYADSKLCGKCNEWLESNCGDPECDYCRERPERPLTMRSFS